MRLLKGSYRDQAGFTLIEMLIVVMLLGIIAVVVIPQMSVSTEDAKLNSLKSNLSTMCSAIELHYYQHNNVYPGMKKTDGTGADVATAAEGATAFVDQLTKYTEVSGKAAADSSTLTNPMGPYLKGGKLPTNRYDNDNDVKADIATTDSTSRTADGSASWRIFLYRDRCFPRK